MPMTETSAGTKTIHDEAGPILTLSSVEKKMDFTSQTSR